MLLKLIEMEIQLALYVENIIFQECHYIDGINYMMVPKNLLLTNHISQILNIPMLILMKKLNGLKI